MLENAPQNCLPNVDYNQLCKFVHDHIDVFKVAFSRGLPERIPPLRIELTAETSPVEVRLRNYSEEQRESLMSMTTQLLYAGMADSNASA